MVLFITTSFILSGFSLLAKALNNEVQIQVNGSERCIRSNGIPELPVGQFLKSENPNIILIQKVLLFISLEP